MIFNVLAFFSNWRFFNVLAIILVLQPLVEDNYGTWVQSISMALTVKNNIRFVDDVVKEPSGDKPDQLQKWKRCNNLVKTGYWGQCRRKLLAASFTAKTSARCGLISKSDPLICGTIKEIASYMKTQKTMKLLMCLNDSYATVRSNALLLEPLSTVNQAYSLVLQLERRAEISNGKTSTQLEAAVFAVKNPSRECESEEKGLRCEKCNKMNHNTKNFRAHLKCTFWGWKGHTFDYCIICI